MSDDIIRKEELLKRRENILGYLDQQITNLLQHVSANSLNEQVFATFGKIFEFYFSSEKQIVKLFIVKEQIFKKEQAELNFLMSEIVNIRSCWKNGVSIESKSIAYLRSHQRGVATTVKSVNSQLRLVM
jgi:hypothetical protein